MGILSHFTNLFGSKQRLQPGPADDFWYNSIGPKSLAGVHVDEATAMNYSACWAATRLLSECLASLPRFLFEHNAIGGKVQARAHPAFNLFHSEPNSEQGGFGFFAMQTAFLINWGNCFAEIQRDQLGRVVRLWPIHPSRIPAGNIRRNPTSPLKPLDAGKPGDLVFWVNNNDGSKTPFTSERLFHLAGALSEDGITGKGVIRQAAESIGMGLATERFGANFFGEGASPTVVMTHPKFLGPEVADNLRRSWRERYSGPGKANGFMVLEEGTKIDRLSVPPEEAQFLQTRQFNITEIARWYNVPVHLLREMSKSSFNNIEQENLHFVKFSLMPWVSRWECELNRQLLTKTEKPRLFFKFMLQGLLRGDSAAQAEFYSKMFAIGAFSINDILQLEDRNPIGEDGDRMFVPLNMTTIDQVGVDPTPQQDLQAKLLDELLAERRESRQQQTKANAMLQKAVDGFVRAIENRQPKEQKTNGKHNKHTNGNAVVRVPAINLSGKRD